MFTSSEILPPTHTQNFSLKPFDETFNESFVFNQHIHRFNRDAKSLSEQYHFLKDFLILAKQEILKSENLEKMQEMFKVWYESEKILEKLKILHFHFMHFSTAEKANKPLTIIQAHANLDALIKSVPNLKGKNEEKISRLKSRLQAYLKDENLSELDSWEFILEEIMKLKIMIFEEVFECASKKEVKQLKKFLKKFETLFYPGFSTAHQTNHCDPLFLESKKNLIKFSLPFRASIHSLGAEAFNALIEGNIAFFNDAPFTLKKLTSGTNLIYIMSQGNEKAIIKVYVNDNLYSEMIPALRTTRLKLTHAASDLLGENYLFKTLFKVIDNQVIIKGTIEIIEYMKDGNLDRKFFKLPPNNDNNNKLLRKAVLTRIHDTEFEIQKTTMLSALFAKKIVQLIMPFEKVSLCAGDLKNSNFFLIEKIDINNNHELVNLSEDDIIIKFADSKSMRYCPNYPFISGTNLYFTEQYLPPEIDSNELKNDIQIDVERIHRHQFGIALYEMITGDESLKEELRKGTKTLEKIDFSNEIFKFHPTLIKAIQSLLDPNETVPLAEIVKGFNTVFDEAKKQFQKLLKEQTPHVVSSRQEEKRKERKHTLSNKQPKSNSDSALQTSIISVAKDEETKPAKEMPKTQSAPAIRLQRTTAAKNLQLFPPNANPKSTQPEPLPIATNPQLIQTKSLPPAATNAQLTQSHSLRTATNHGLTQSNPLPTPPNVANQSKVQSVSQPTSTYLPAPSRNVPNPFKFHSVSKPTPIISLRIHPSNRPTESKSHAVSQPTIATPVPASPPIVPNPLKLHSVSQQTTTRPNPKNNNNNSATVPLPTNVGKVTATIKYFNEVKSNDNSQNIDSRTPTATEKKVLK